MILDVAVRSKVALRGRFLIIGRIGTISLVKSGRPRGHIMTTRPRFTLKAILGCTAALCVPLAMYAAGDEPR